MEEEGKLKINEDEITDLIDSNEEDPTSQQEGGAIRGLMNLVTLTNDDLETLQEGRLVNDACIDALGDVLQSSVDKKEVSICHTGFWAAAREYGWGNEAKTCIHPDPEDTDVERW
jgi:Ulp1 family protease